MKQLTIVGMEFLFNIQEKLRHIMDVSLINVESEFDTSVHMVGSKKWGYTTFTATDHVNVKIF